MLRYTKPVEPFASDDPDSSRIWWDARGVHQNLAFPVQPDPLFGMNCWLQIVRLQPAHAGDRYGDIYVDRRRARAVADEWLWMTRATLGPDRQRRPEFFMRMLRVKRRAYRAAPG